MSMEDRIWNYMMDKPDIRLPIVPLGTYKAASMSSIWAIIFCNSARQLENIVLLVGNILHNYAD